MIEDIELNDGYFDSDGTYHDGGDGILYIWKPIGYYSEADTGIWTGRQFYGNFDGRNHTVSGVYINNPNQKHAGLFGLVFNGYIKNLSLKNSYYNVYEGGGIIGLAYNSSELTNLKNYSNINNISGGFSGVIGISYITTIENCINYGDVQTTNYAVGIARGSSCHLIINSYNYGNLTGSSAVAGIMTGATNMKYCDNYGDLLSTNSNWYNQVTGIGQSSNCISNCNNYGTIQGVSAVCGVGLGTIIENCDNFGNVIGIKENSDTIVGIGFKMSGEYYIYNCKNFGHIKNVSSRGAGLVARGSPMIENCSNFGTVSGKNELGGLVVSVDSGTTIKNCVNRGDVCGTGAVIGGIIGSGANLEGIKIINVLNVCNIIRKATTTGTIGAIWSGGSKIHMKNIVSYGVLNGENYKEYFGQDFSMFFFTWKTGEIGLYPMSGKGFFQGKVTEDLLIQKGFVKA